MFLLKSVFTPTHSHAAVGAHATLLTYRRTPP